MLADRELSVSQACARLWVTTRRFRFAWVLVPAFAACGFGSDPSGGPLDLLGVAGEAGAAGAAAGGEGGAARATGGGGTLGQGGSGQGGSGRGGSGHGTLAQPLCGDGELDASEECDDANLVAGDGCDAHCFLEAAGAVCGNGRVDAGEGCDDANLRPGDGCDGRCQVERCGNDQVDAGEECDPPAIGECGDSCLRWSPRCGDTVVQEAEHEQCDDANDDANDGCHECRLTCGNGRLDRDLGEECEPAWSAQGSCSEDCRYVPVCGDGLVEPEAGEHCDPDNGLTCVACQIVEPPPVECDEATGQGGACPPPPECVPAAGGPSGPGELVQNGRFEASLEPWERHQERVSLALVSEGVPDPEALKVTFDGGPVRAMSGAFQCVPIEAGAKYLLEAEYFIPENAPEGVRADVTILLYAGPRCEGDWVPPPGLGPVGGVRNIWTPYHYRLDTSPLFALGGDVSQARALIRLNVTRPADVEGSWVLWDNVSMGDAAAQCSNCVVDAGETCDDGNRTAGDGCDRYCEREVCGNGVVQTPEQCDDGNAFFGADGDSCTPSCKAPSDCDSCAASACADELSACAGLEGQAQAGPGAGVARSTLCDRLRSCVHDSACNRVERVTEGVTGEFLENCYCGSAGASCFETSGSANGSCKAEIEAALETADPIQVFERFGGSDPSYPITAGLDALLDCEQDECEAECVQAPACGDGKVQDRNVDFVFSVDRQDVPCRDDLTHTGRGCSFEECDDGNTAPGDGCDQYCFVEACGNHVVQAGEACDDGNQEDGDGCSAECQAEYTCGNSVTEAPFEECDPPDSGQVCTLSQYEADPGQCGCDQACSRLVCGNGVLQRPAEDCDPPSTTCGDDCKLLDGGPCEDCLNSVDDEETYGLQTFNREVCNKDPLCFNIKACFAESGCWASSAGRRPSDCFCGIGADTTACEEDPDFELTGPCADEILAGAGVDNPTNVDVLNRYYDPAYPLGVAGLIFSTVETFRVCLDECRVQICGDNVVQAGEACDDGNLQAGDGCDGNCQEE